MTNKQLKEAAARLLSTQVYLPIFQAKLASNGIKVRNQQELIQYCMLAHQLRTDLQKKFGFVDFEPTPLEKLASRIFIQRNPHIYNAAKLLLRAR